MQVSHVLLRHHHDQLFDDNLAVRQAPQPCLEHTLQRTALQPVGSVHVHVWD